MNVSFTQFFTRLLDKTPYESYRVAYQKLVEIRKNISNICFKNLFIPSLIINAFITFVVCYPTSSVNKICLFILGVLFGLLVSGLTAIAALDNSDSDHFFILSRKARKIKKDYLNLRNSMIKELKVEEFQHALSIYLNEYIRDFKHTDPKTEIILKEFLINQYDVIKKSLIMGQYEDALDYIDYLFIRLKKDNIDLVYQHKESLFNDIELSYRENLNLGEEIKDNSVVEKEINGYDIAFKKRL